MLGDICYFVQAFLAKVFVRLSFFIGIKNICIKLSNFFFQILVKQSTFVILFIILKKFSKSNSLNIFLFEVKYYFLFIFITTTLTTTP